MIFPVELKLMAWKERLPPRFVQTFPDRYRELTTKSFLKGTKLEEAYPAWGLLH
jgi:hypothetical protein